MTNTNTEGTNDMTDTVTTVEMDILIRKIEKMWRRANHPNTPPAERDVAQAKALSLMEQHRIEKAMLNIDEADVLGDHEYGKVTGSYGKVYIGFISAVAQAFDCRVFYHNWGMDYTVSMTGFRSDAERVRALASFLLADAVAQAAEFKSTSISETKDYRRAFVNGYRAEIAQRLREAAAFGKQEAVEVAVRDATTVARIEAQSDPDMTPEDVEEYVEYAAAEARVAVEQRVTGAALVLVEKAKQVNAEYSKKKLRSASRTSGGRSSTGYSNGRIAGRNADLTGGRRGRVGAGSKALGR